MEQSHILVNSENFPDEAFRNFLLEQDFVKDGKIFFEDIKNITEIDCKGQNIKSLKGIEFFTELKVLNCGFNGLESLDVSKNTKLIELDCSENQLTSLDLSKNTKLKYLKCDNNQLTSLDLSKNTKLENLYCSDNQITSLNLTNNKKLKYLNCDKNPPISLSLSDFTANFNPKKSI